MYCRMCGNKIEDTDHYCQYCGSPTGYKEAPAAPAVETDGKEEVVFNPPYDNKSHFAEEEDLKEFISEDEIEEVQKEERDEEPEALKNTEFTWNIYEFPTARKKTEDVAFNWNLEEYSRQEEKEEEAVAFEEELFREIRDDSSRIREQNIDRFFTFSRKNEEFQELLDREYEKFKLRPESEAEPEVGGEAPSDQVAVTEEIHTDSEIKEEKKEPVAEAPHAEHIAEMAEARAQFFGEELICDNESIRRKLTFGEMVDQRPEEEAAREGLPVEEAPPEAEVPPEEEAPAEEAPAGEADKTEEQQEETDRRAESVAAAYAAVFGDTGENAVPAPYLAEETPAKGEQEEVDEKQKKSVGQIMLVIIAIILVIEIAILGIRYFMPESGAAKAIGNAQTEIFNTVSGWFGGANEESSGEEDEAAPGDGDQDPGENKGQQEEPDGQQPSANEDKSAPDPNPMTDKNALVASQLGNNINIEQVRANAALAYQPGRNYGNADINNSKPIANNIWQTPETGDTVYYDKSIVGAVIAFDSQWIDYVNDGNRNVLNVLKKDSEAYRKTVSFSRVGKIKETFKLLEIGEIRQGSKGFYIWVHEEIRITENGAAADKKYNWIYYLEPLDGKMQIVDYYKF